MPAFPLTCSRLRKADLLSGVALGKEMRKRIFAATQLLHRPPCLVVVLVGERPDSLRYIEHKKRAAAQCGIEVRLVRLAEKIRQAELHKALASVNNDVLVDAVILQLPLPPHLRARPALFHIHPGKDVDGLHPLNAGNLFLQDQSPLMDAFTQPPAMSSSTVTTSSLAAPWVADQRAHALTAEVLLLATNSGGYNAVRRRTHESKFFVPCTALAIRSLLFSYLSLTEGFGHLRSAMQNDMSKLEESTSHVAAAAATSAGLSASSSTPTRRDLHAVIVNKSMVVGVPTAALLQRAGGFIVTSCSRSNSLDAVRQVARHADVLITAYGQANVFNASCVKEGAIVIDAAINELPSPPSNTHEEGTQGLNGHHGESGGGGGHPHRKARLCGDVDVESASTVAAAITKTPGGVGPLTVSHLMMNVLKAYRIRHANYYHYNNIYTEFLKMYGTYDKVRDYAPSAGVALKSGSQTVDSLDANERRRRRDTRDDGDWESEMMGDQESVDDDDAHNESYEV